MLFAELTYTLATEEAERIGVDHVARMTATGTGENSTGNVSAHVGHWENIEFLSHMHPRTCVLFNDLQYGLLHQDLIFDGLN